jgi:DNA-binding MarR family transcriptional regulator
VPHLGLGRMLLDAVGVFDTEMHEALRDRGLELTPSQAASLLLVDRTGTRLTELAERAGVSKQAMMQMVDTLQEMGSVRRAVDPNDARAKAVKLTARGIRQRAEARRGLANVESRLRRRLGERRYDGLRTILEELIEGEE